MADGTSAGSYFYRELIKGTKNYRFKKIEGASSMDEAEQLVFALAVEMNSKPDISFIEKGTGATDVGKPKRKKTIEMLVGSTGKRTRSQPIEKALRLWLETEQEKADAGLLEPSAYTSKEISARLHIAPYLATQGVEQTNQIKLTTFDDYLIYRREATPLTRKKEIGHIKEWCRSYLVKHRLMDSDLLLNREFIPKATIRQTDLMANPAVSPEDWKAIVDYVREDWRHKFKQNVGERGWVFANIFWHFILFAKNSGFSGEEMMKLRWKQIEIVNEGRLNSKGEKVDWEVAYVRTIRAKTKQAREVPVNQARELRRLKGFIEDWIKEKQAPLTITPDTLVFGNPENNFQPFCYDYISRKWREIVDYLMKKEGKLKGNRFTDHNYTLYSLRTTFIQDALMRGVPVIEVAQMAGHDIVQTQRFYTRLDLRKRGRELTLPEMGKRLGEGEPVDLFGEDE